MFSLSGYDGTGGDASAIYVKGQTTVLDANGDDVTSSLISEGVLVGATHDVFALVHYDNSDGDAAKIFVRSRSEVAVFDEDFDVTAYLIARSILVSYCVGHGWVDALTNASAVEVKTASALAVDVLTADALAINVSETLVLMSEVRNAGETPIFFARIEDSATGVPFTQSHVDSVTYTIYRYDQTTARNGSSGKTPVDELRSSGSGSGSGSESGSGSCSGSVSWTNVSVPVADCFLNTPVDNDQRVPFAYNFRFEPDTLEDNPFDTPGRYSVEFTITPTTGNRIPVIFNVALT